jgi:hypothetical protein
MRLFLISISALASIILHGGSSSFAAESAADECTPITLDSPGGTMEEIVARTPKIMQSGGVCTFHAAAEMFDAWRTKYDAPVTNSTSPLALAMQFSLRTGHHNFELTGGDANPNLHELLQYGGCPRENYNPLTGQDMDEYYYNEVSERFEALQASYAATVLSFTNPKPPGIWDVTTKIEQLVLSFAAKYPGYPLNKSIDFAKLEGAFVLNDFVSFMNEMIPMNCANSARIFANKPYSVVEFVTKDGSSAPKLAVIHEELNRGLENAFPLGIGYCANVLDAGRAYKPISMANPNCGRHESLIIGRRPNPKTGICQFLVRNSWSRHSPYSSDWEKLPNMDHVWVDADTLVTAIHDITTVQ